jgi:hypothetical protein
VREPVQVLMHLSKLGSHRHASLAGHDLSQEAVFRTQPSEWPAPTTGTRAAFEDVGISVGHCSVPKQPTALLVGLGE